MRGSGPGRQSGCRAVTEQPPDRGARQRRRRRRPRRPPSGPSCAPTPAVATTAPSPPGARPAPPSGGATTVGYGDGLDTPAGADRPSARRVSNRIAAATGSRPNSRNLSDYIWQWGQFLDHDLDLTLSATPAEVLPGAGAARRPLFRPQLDRLDDHPAQPLVLPAGLQRAPADQQHHHLHRRLDGLRLGRAPPPPACAANDGSAGSGSRPAACCRSPPTARAPSWPATSGSTSRPT